jgi:signal transduction histidine kinase
MTGDEASIAAIAAAWAGVVCVLGLAVAWLLRRRPLSWLSATVALVAVAAVVAAVVGTARAMFLSHHDFVVVIWAAVVAGLVALAFALVVAAALRRWSRDLRDEARRFGESGRFDAGTGAPLPAELRELAAELEATSARLAESRAREERLEESRRELVSWVSHDLRTPLAGIRAMSEALEDGIASDPDRYHRQIRGEVDRMVSMVDDLFELSRIHAGVLRLQPEVVLLGDLVSEAVAAADPVARRHRVRVGGDVQTGLEVVVDPAGLSRVLGNLIVNGVRHTPADGTVHVSARVVGDEVELAVADECGGIDIGTIDRVFDVAYRGAEARTPEDPASTDADSRAGLGLAIVKGIVEAHRGRVEVANTGPGGTVTGCRFVVRLPR